MASASDASPDSVALEGLRRRGQFLISGLLWASVAGLVVVASGWALFVYHYAVALAERARASFGISAPAHGPDWFLLSVLASGPLVAMVAAFWFAGWYRRIWLRRIRTVWTGRRELAVFSRWQPIPERASDADRKQRGEYLTGLLASAPWAHFRCSPPSEAYEEASAAVLLDMERDIAERALTTGLTVGLSRNRYVDLFTIFAAALELQLHVLSRLGKRPSGHTWRLLIQRCGASLFLNSYLNRQDALSLNLMIKKAGMGLYASGDLMENAAHHLSDNDYDLDEALNLQHGGLVGMAAKGIELGATMALTVGQVGLHVLGNLIESVGDELAQGALAAGVIYYHGMALAADTLALDQAHRQSPAMTRSFRESVWKMGEIAGSILRDAVRQRRTAFRERRKQMVRSLPKSAYVRVQQLFGRKTANPQPS
jgi:hypothetical protein